MTKIGGEISGITSAKVSQLENAVEQHRAEAIAAMIDYYATDDADARAIADQKVREAYGKAMSAGTQRDGLKEIQADAQASRGQIADWAKLI